MHKPGHQVPGHQLELSSMLDNKINHFDFNKFFYYNLILTRTKGYSRWDRKFYDIIIITDKIFSSLYGILVL
jgi:hypothetical protein